MLEIGMIIKNDRNMDICYKIVDVQNNRTSAKVQLMPYNMGNDGESFPLGFENIITTQFDYEKLNGWRYAKDGTLRSFRDAEWVYFT